MILLSIILTSFSPLLASAIPREPWEPADPAQATTMPYPFYEEDRSELQAAKDGTAVIVPDEYWATAQYFNIRYSPELWRFLEDPFSSSAKTQPLADWVINATEQTPSVQIMSLSMTGGIIKPSINGMNRAYVDWRYQARFDVPWLYCRCGEVECTPKDMAYKMQEQPPWQSGVQAYFDILVDLLSNDTMIPMLEGLKISDKPASDQDKLIAKAANIPLTPTQTLRLQLVKLQYGLYQQLVRGDNDCPVPVVECGKHGSNPCDRYPPATKTTTFATS